MTFDDLGRTALSNLGRRKVRTILTSFGVVVGILTIVTMVSLSIGVRKEIDKQFDAIGLERVFVRPREGERSFFTQFARQERNNPITAADVERWRELPNVSEVVPDIELPTGINASLQIDGNTLGNVGLSGADTFQIPFQAPPVALAGSIEEPSEPGRIVLTEGSLRDAGLSSADYTSWVDRPVQIVLETPRGEQQSFDYIVAGVSNEEFPVLRVSLADRAAIKSWWYNRPDLLATDGYDMAIVRAVDVNAARELVAQVRNEGFRVQSLELILDLADQVFTILNVMLSSVGGLALLVASLGIVNTMIMSIYERTREIGTLKAIGASRGDIRLLFMTEAGIIGLLGGMIGIAGGWALGRLLNRVILWYIEREQLPIRGDFFVVTPSLALYALLFAIAVGIVAGLYPANRAARLDPLMALRHE